MARRTRLSRERLALSADRLHDEVDKRPDLGWPVSARRINRVERKHFVIPSGEEFDEQASREPFLGAQLYDLSNAGARDAGV